MATMSWRCPVSGCSTESEHAGVCRIHLVSLRRIEPTGEAGETTTPTEPASAARPTQPPAAVALSFPWGQLVEVPADGLMIGRHSPVFNERIREYDQISRRHARLWWRDGQLFIDDCHSLNQTFLDGEPLVPGQPVALRPGQRLRLGLDVHVDIVELNEFGEPRTPGKP